jgi:cytochrome subunit of sulfide dehydrogenase
MRPLTFFPPVAHTALLLAVLAAPALVRADSLQDAALAASCAGCHGTQGQAQPGMVALSGQPAATLRTALQGFKAGTRPATVMQQLAKGYSDEQLDQLARYFAALKP